MVLPNVVLRLLAVACVVTGIAFAGGAMAASGAADLAAPTVAVAAKADAVEVQSPACARKVKVVYSGYGEADRVTCSAAVKTGE